MCDFCKFFLSFFQFFIAYRTVFFSIYRLKTTFLKSRNQLNSVHDFTKLDFFSIQIARDSFQPLKTGLFTFDCIHLLQIDWQIFVRTFLIRNFTGICTFIGERTFFCVARIVIYWWEIWQIWLSQLFNDVFMQNSSL